MNNRFCNTKSMVSLFLMLALLLTMAGCFSACSNKDSASDQTPMKQEEQEELPQLNQEPTNSFLLKITKADGSTKTITVKTFCLNVGDALVEEGIASGEKGANGWELFTVDGETHKNDGKRWVFYVDDMLSPKGVSEVMVNAASEYFELRVESLGD